MVEMTGYARVGSARIAYKVIGEGNTDLVMTPGSFVAFDTTEDDPMSALYFRRLGSISRVIRFDRRGAGSSDPVPLDALPNLEAYAEETLAVMDTVGSERATIMAGYDAGPMAILLASTYPDRITGLILVNTTARYLADDDYPPGVPAEVVEQLTQVFEEAWGTEEAVRLYVPSKADDPQFVSWFARAQRLSITPLQAITYLQAWFHLDVRSLLPTVPAPTLVMHRENLGLIPLAHGRYIADQIPGARLHILPGSDGPVLWEAQDEVLDTVEEFVTNMQPAARVNRVISTVVFTDIVDSTRLAEEMGDRKWRAMLETHDDITARTTATNGGRLIKTTGDGCMATFDGPGRAITSACQLRKELGRIGIAIRTGIHTGEIELRGSDDVAGLGVHLAARIMGEASPGEILTSNTVKDLVVGSDFRFDDRGLHSLKGFDEEWRLFAVEMA
jgi:class 3 adenylate cyclase/pimeloyl-ACP methyl ester carboxylesterase